MRKHLLLSAFLLIVSPLVGLGQPALPTGLNPAKFHLYLLVGQSDMAGRGKVDTLDKTPHPRVWMLNRAGQWVPATEPLHFDKPDVVGVGPGLAFGKQMANADTSVFIGLIPSAVGGSGIDSWQPGGYHEQTKSHPYDEAVSRGQLAKKTGTLYGILWHQGESDSKSELVAGYAQKLTQLIGRYRQAFNSPNLPVVVGTLGDFYVVNNPAAAQINALLRTLPARDPRTACVDASGLTDKGDQTHFDAASARELGLRYANVMQTFQPKK